MEWKFDCSRIAIARESRDMNQNQLAMAIGATQSQVSQWEKGEVVPGQLVLEKICNALGSPPGFFYVQRAKDGKADTEQN